MNNTAPYKKITQNRAKKTYQKNKTTPDAICAKSQLDYSLRNTKIASRSSDVDDDSGTSKEK